MKGRPEMEGRKMKRSCTNCHVRGGRGEGGRERDVWQSFDHVCLLPVAGGRRWFRGREERETRKGEGEREGREDGH